MVISTEFFHKNRTIKPREIGDNYSPAEDPSIEDVHLILGEITSPANPRRFPQPSERTVQLRHTGMRASGDVRQNKNCCPRRHHPHPANAVRSSFAIGNDDFIFVLCKKTSWVIIGIKAIRPRKRDHKNL